MPVVYLQDVLPNLKLKYISNWKLKELKLKILFTKYSQLIVVVHFFYNFHLLL